MPNYTDLLELFPDNITEDVSAEDCRDSISAHLTLQIQVSNSATQTISSFPATLQFSASKGGGIWAFDNPNDYIYLPETDDEPSGYYLSFLTMRTYRGGATGGIFTFKLMRWNGSAWVQHLAPEFASIELPYNEYQVITLALVFYAKGIDNWSRFKWQVERTGTDQLQVTDAVWSVYRIK